MLHITSETGRLKKVLLHLPGAEIERMVPSMMGDLLFDDILYGERAREEHRRLRTLIEIVADEVLEFSDLLVEVLESPDARKQVLEDLRQRLGLEPDVMSILEADGAHELASHLTEGILRPGMPRMPEDPTALFLLAPLPNLFFQRDPGVVIGDRVALSSMATEARRREPLLLSYLLTHHPALRGAGPPPVLFQPFEAGFKPSSSVAHPRPTIEGGDVLVVREDVLVVGISVRTRRATVEELAVALKQSKSPPRKVIVVELPRARSFMHLDTVFTMISERECLIYEPAILAGGAQEADVYQLDLGRREVTYTAKSSLLGALKGVGLDLEPIPCGGPDDPIAQQREQWTDGANAFALAPGVILCYERNVRTAEELDRRGYEIVYEDDLLLGRTQLELGRKKRRKYAVQMEAHELSRARGGPRCMTMPLSREPLPG